MMNGTGDHDRHAGHPMMHGWRRLAWLALAVALAFGVSNCSQTQTPTTETGGPAQESTSPGPEQDQFARQGAIDDSGKVAPGTIELSKSAGDRVQWKNNSRDTMVVYLIDAPIGELIPPGRFSISHRVCVTCSTGFYGYVVRRLVSGLPERPSAGAPTEPQIGVGD
jgi:hypothetical protein